jgi:CheY-like chemotaxis protein
MVDTVHLREVDSILIPSCRWRGAAASVAATTRAADIPQTPAGDLGRGSWCSLTSSPRIRRTVAGTMSITAVDHRSVLRIAICERRQFDRAALRALCSHDAHLLVVAEAGDGAELLAQLSDDQRLVVLIGRSTIRQEGAGLVAHIRAALPHARIVVVGISGESAPSAATEAGADGFLARDGDLADQLAAVYG